MQKKKKRKVKFLVEIYRELLLTLIPKNPEHERLSN